MEEKIKLSILMPVLNEGSNLKILLPVFETLVEIPHEILIVYDIPEDNSIPAVKQLQKKYAGLRLVHNNLGRGIINALKAGVKEAQGEYVLLIAADDIGPALIIKDMVYLMDNGCDLVNGTRYAYGGKNIGGVFMSQLLSRIANKMFRLLSGSLLTDPTLGVKMFRRSKFNEVRLESKPVGWAVSFEFAIKAQIAKWKLGEVPLISLNRIFGGKSSFKLGAWVSEYTKWFLWGVAKMPRGNNIKPAVRLPAHLSTSNN